MTHDNGANVKQVWIIQHPDGRVVGVYADEETALEVQRVMTSLSGWAGNLSAWEVFAGAHAR